MNYLSMSGGVTFRTNGGSELDDIIVQIGEKIQQPEEPVRKGYQLQGWYKDIHLTDEWSFDEDTVEGNMSLYAKWIAEEPLANVKNEYSRIWLVYISVLLIIICMLILWRRKEKEK